MRLDGQVAVITGSGSGIGRATALLFANEGARVVGVDSNEETAEPVRHGCGSFHVGQADISTAADCERTVDGGLTAAYVTPE